MFSLMGEDGEGCVEEVESLKCLRADTSPSGRGMAGGSPEHLEGNTSLGEVRKVSKAGGSVLDHLGKVLSCGGSGGATLWV